ncbi:virion protein [Xanthomonas phage XAJ2]|uniref:Virion protein n=1 Tax=Xanthomonas phage XAJ2 TaxID=1775249 RepID=A0A1I9L2E3_9CAUD|nr:virion protein [Xanthomonas phage XAJ2]
MLIIEDGTGKADSQSYVTVDEYKVFAQLRGFTVPSSDDEIERILILAVDLTEAEDRYGGRKTKSTQSLKFPRSGLLLDCEKFPSDAIPKQIKLAQMHLAAAAADGVVLQPVISGNAADYVIKEKVDVIETEYADPTKFSGTATFTAVDALLKELFNGGGTAFSFKVRRG